MVPLLVACGSGCLCVWQSLQSRLPRQDDVSGELGRNALIGFLATVVSDCLSNGFTVIKVRTAAQTTR